MKMTRLMLAALIALLLGCAGPRIGPLYTEQELKTACMRQGGWWRGDGFCEYPGRL